MYNAGAISKALFRSAGPLFQHVPTATLTARGYPVTCIMMQKPSMPLIGSNSLLRSSLSSSASDATLHKTIRQRLNDALFVAEASTLSYEKKTKDLCQYYQKLIPEQKSVLLKMLATDFNVNQTAILHLANQLAQAQNKGPSMLLHAEEKLRHALIPKYQQLFTHISRLDNGVKFLVDLRTDLLNILRSDGSDHNDAYLHSMNSCLRDLLALWFSVGFLQLERITWQSPANMLQKISEYEAVHPIRNWTDLMRRVGPYRRCFIFTHNTMPHEPVVVLHTALTDSISSNIQSIVTRSTVTYSSDNGNPYPEPQENTDSIKAAVFYSITSTQKGLQAIEMGNYLIKSVVMELLAEIPHLAQFSSLSPIPGLREWIQTEIHRHAHRHSVEEISAEPLFLPEEMSAIKDAFGCKSRLLFETLQKSLRDGSWAKCEQYVTALKAPFLRLCAKYLYVEKRRGFALNHVANFHLRNGAVMWRINWMGDPTIRGLSASCGMMVNYRYYLDLTEQNSRQYVENKVVQASESVLSLVAQTPLPSRTESSI